MATLHNLSALPGLAEIAAGRDYINTKKFSFIVDKSEQTIRKNYCLTGHCYGIRPTKVGNDLLWPVEKIAEVLLNGGADSEKVGTSGKKTQFAPTLTES